MADNYTLEIKVDGDRVSTKKLNRLDTSLKKIDDTGKKSAKSMATAGASITSFAKVAVVGFGAVAVGVGVATVKLVGFASELEETQSKFNTVFRDLAGTANTWAEDFGKSVGRAEADVKRWLSGLQDTFVPLGIARDESFALAKTLTTLAVDVASFNNAMDDETIDLFTSALVGNHEAVRRFGIIITEAELKIEAQRQGMKGNTAQMSALQKVQLRYNIIMRATSDAQGDALRTADSYANQVKRMQANAKDIATELGQALLPALTGVVTATNDWISANERLISNGKDFLAWIAGGEIDGVTKEIRDLTTEIEKLRDRKNEGILGFLFRDTGDGTSGLGGPGGGAGLDIIIEAMEMRRRALEAAAGGGVDILGGPTRPATTITPDPTAGFGGSLQGAGGGADLRGRPEDDTTALTGFELLAQVPEATKVAQEAFAEMDAAIIPILQNEAAEIDAFNQKTLRLVDTAVAIGQAFTGAFIDIGTGAKSAGDAILSATISAAGMMATTWGSVHVAMGTAELLTPGMQATGAAHIRSGIALQVLGGTISGLAGSISGGGGGGSGSGGSFAGGVTVPGGRTRGGDGASTPTVIVIQSDGTRVSGNGSLGRRLLSDSVDNRQLGLTIAELRRTGASLD